MIDSESSGTGGKRQVCEIERSQRALRESIEKARELLDRSEHMLSRHRIARERASED
jgi:hypothetical protein